MKIINFEDEKSLKNPSKKELTSEIANPLNDKEYVVYNNQYFNQDKTLQKFGNQLGIRLYDDVLKDLHAFSVLNTRFLSVVGKEWNIKPASDMLRDRKIAEFVNDVLYNTNFDFIRYKLLNSILYGFYCAEIIWKVNNGKIIIDKFIDKHPIKFTFDADRNLRLLTKDNIVYGIPIPDKKFLIMKYGTIDNPWGNPLGRSLYWYVYFKKTNVKFWLIFAERFGQPALLGSYPNGTLESDRQQIQDVLNSIQTNSSIVLPEDIKIQLLEATRSGGANTYAEFCDFCNREMSKAVLGQVLTTENSGTGSYALGKIQNEVRQDITESDADVLDETLNETLIKWIVDLNFNVTEYPKIITNTTPPTNLLEKSQIDKNLSDIGVRLTNDYFKKTYSLEDEDIVNQ